MNIQERAELWHRKKFRESHPLAIFTKSVEELGEVATALIFDLGQEGATGKKGDVPAECADVVICLLALVGRYYPGTDVLSLVEQKLDLLLTPGAHKSGVTEYVDC